MKNTNSTPSTKPALTWTQAKDEILKWAVLTIVGLIFMKADKIEQLAINLDHRQVATETKYAEIERRQNHQDDIITAMQEKITDHDRHIAGLEVRVFGHIVRF